RVSSRAALRDLLSFPTRRSSDLARYAPSPETRDKILQNRIYRHLSGTLSGSQEYMAMEKLYEVYRERDYDLIVLDTPPTAHALDDRKSTRLNSSHDQTSYAVFCL